MKLLYIVIILFTFSIILKAQDSKVGIGIEDPMSALDVNGGISINNVIFLGGDDNNLGDSGSPNWTIALQKGNNIKWEPIGYKVPEYGNYFLENTLIKNDLSGGIVIDYYDNINSQSHNENQLLTSNWKTFDDLSFSVQPSTRTRKIILQIEMVVTASIKSTSGWASFSVGVATNQNGVRELKAVRSSSCQGVNNPEQLIILTIVLDNITFKKETKIEIVAAYRNTNLSTKPYLYFGRDVDNMQSLPKRATMRADIFTKFRE